MMPTVQAAKRKPIKCVYSLKIIREIERITCITLRTEIIFFSDTLAELSA